MNVSYKDMFLFILGILFIATSCTGVNRINNEQQSGIIFLKQREVIFTGDRWVVVANLKFQNFDELIKEVENVLTYVSETNYANPENTSELIPKAEIMSLKFNLNNLKQEIASYKQMLPMLSKVPFNETKQVKRGLINVIGSGIKFLLGNPDSFDLESLNE